MIVDNPAPIIGHRGQLYIGERNPSYSGNYGYGEGLNFSTDFGDSSTYASNNPMLNLDLVGNLEHKLLVEGVIDEFTTPEEKSDLYNQARNDIEKAGDGFVYTSSITPKKLMKFGYGNFLSIPDEQRFKCQFDLALVEADAPLDMDERERITRFIVKFNSEPMKVMSFLKSNKAVAALRQFASINNCDAYMLSKELSPTASHTPRAEHIILLDESVHEVIDQRAPHNIDVSVFSPNYGILNFEKARNAYSAECKEIRSIIACEHSNNQVLDGGDFKAKLVSAATSAEDSQPPSLLQPSEQRSNSIKFR
ncbi:conserved hypothetical protein [Vibrio chagasii]|nr:conserved hypothetical protein [Vibrio chagasii]